MIIDCHGHYTTSPKALEDFRQSQIAGLKDQAHVPAKGTLAITDAQIRESLEGAQLKMQRERGTDLTIFSPRAMGMSHHIGVAARLCTALAEARVNAVLRNFDPWYKAFNVKPGDRLYLPPEQRVRIW